MKGALVEIPPVWTEISGNKCDLVITLENTDITIVMEMEIAHVDKETIGLRSLSIDLESMTHLRRLLELNLGDPNLIERELALLG